MTGRCGTGMGRYVTPRAGSRSGFRCARRGILAGERGAGSILALAVVTGTVLLTTLVISTLALQVVGRSVANAADAAALAAADTASGAIAGYPCEAATAVAAVNDATLIRCEVEGLIASVSVQRGVRSLSIAASARAGPPEAAQANRAP